MTIMPDLPVTGVLDEVAGKLARSKQVVLAAPPGAGKTTLVPLHLLSSPWLEGRRIVLLEPRRLAARAAARRMASLLGEKPGGTVGYAMRLDRKVSAATRILVVTEGVFTRMALDDPELSGIGVVIFDEYHERSLDADFGLALALDIAGALRPDLRILVMSATIDGATVSALMDDAEVVECSGRAFPVDYRYLTRNPGMEIEDLMANTIRETLGKEQGSILAFLPGQGEISRTLEKLAGRVASDTDVIALHGGLGGRAQDTAIRPAPQGRRKVVLATSIAESSITIDGVRIVIDSGLARLPKFEPATGITRLQTVRVSQASAAQRAGRAGRTAPGIAVRLWSERQTSALEPFAPPEIHEADLSGLLLDCAAFGVTDPRQLRFLDKPPAPALAEARRLLVTLGALDREGYLTDAGRAMRKIALPARLAHMVTCQESRAATHKAAKLAVVLSEHGLGGLSADLDVRLQRFASGKDERSVAARRMAQRIADHLGPPASEAGPEPGIGILLAAAYPDRIAKARGQTGQFVLANGRGAHVDPADPLAKAGFLVVATMYGKARSQRIAAAAEISEAELRSVSGLETVKTVRTWFDRGSASVRAEERVSLGAINLSTQPLPAPTGKEADKALLKAVGEHGPDILPWGKETRVLRQRLQWLHDKLGEPWPDVDDDVLAEQTEIWLEPFLTGDASVAPLAGATLSNALRSLLPPDLHRQIDSLAPTRITVPDGSSIAIRYDDEGPVLAVRVQQIFGLRTHPAIAGGRVPLILELLSPANRPLQKTRDLPGFWNGSWAAVRTEMRGRYPKHDWPEDPATAKPSSGAKRRN